MQPRLDVSSHVVSETIDGETILIHLGTGTYYSLDGVATAAWELLSAGAPPDELADRFAKNYGLESATIAAALAAFVQELRDEELMLEASDDAVASGDAEKVVLPDVPYIDPTLHKYTDMQEFMLVDPLHDVEVDAGWPHVKAG